MKAKKSQRVYYKQCRLVENFNSMQSELSRYQNKLSLIAAKIQTSTRKLSTKKYLNFFQELLILILIFFDYLS